MVKYIIKSGYEDAEVVTSVPIGGREKGARYELKTCTQRDLKYLFEVVKYQGIERVNDEKQAENSQQSKNVRRSK